ncbi:MAG TPA: Gfo/Idh/MocA family oxidoreductase [Pseudolabrys sp.]|nr:Gfo/Idh/MocA family oxidoreductase [Pseudolabrys sp.]
MTDVLAHPHDRAALRRPRLAFLGLGWIGHHRMRAIKESDLAEIAVVADPNPEALAKAALIAHEAKCVGTFDDILDAGIDGVAIATPTALHSQQAVAALERGISVFCQKPLGRTAAEVEAAIAAARRNDRLLAVDLSYRHTEGMQRIRELICRGELGRIFAVDLVFHNAYGPDKRWFYDMALSGGGCVTDLGVHLVDLALWALDFPAVEEASAQLFADGERLPPSPRRVEDYAEATLSLSDGATVRLACSWRLSAGCDAVIAASFYGTKGGASLRNVNGSFYDFAAERFRGTARETLATPPDAWFGRAAVEWVRCLARDKRFDRQAERLIDVAAVIDRIYGR